MTTTEPCTNRDHVLPIHCHFSGGREHCPGWIGDACATHYTVTHEASNIPQGTEQVSVNGVPLTSVTMEVRLSLSAYIEATQLPTLTADDEATAKVRGRITDALKYHAGYLVTTEPGDVLAVVDEVEVSIESMTEWDDPRDADDVRDLIQGRASELS